MAELFERGFNLKGRHWSLLFGVKSGWLHVTRTMARLRWRVVWKSIREQPKSDNIPIKNIHVVVSSDVCGNLRFLLPFPVSVAARESGVRPGSTRPGASSPGRDGRDEGSGNDVGTRPLWQLGGEPREHRTVSHRQLLQVSA